MFFNTGLDEHGLKVFNKSLELGLDIHDYLNSLQNEWISFCKEFKIDYDNFYRTSDTTHHLKVQIIWKKFLERGDIYKKNYQGKYCIGCESFKTDKDLIDNKCNEHTNLDLKIVNEDNYFFKLSKYKDELTNWINSNSEFIEPSNKLNELKNLILESDDISISRLKSNCPWGVEVPDDSEHVIYVWFDALWNYALSAGYLTPNFKWENTIQLCGPDNLRFQGVIFQSFLKSENINYTNKLLVHGTILDKDGQKISKSLGNTIDPLEQLNKFGLTSIRYYLIGGLSTYGNSNWNEEDLIKLYNSDICNDWGNLIARVLHLIDTKSNGVVNTPDDDFIKLINDYKLKVSNSWSDYRFKDVCFTINELVKVGNKYINDEKPWNTDNYIQVLSNLYYLISNVNEFYYPIIPNTYEDVKTAILSKKKHILFNKI